MSYVSLGGLGAVDLASMRAMSATLPTRHACREYWRPWALNPFIGESARRELAACLERTGGLTHPIYTGTSGLGYHAGPLPTPPVAGFGYHSGPLPTPPVAGLGCPCAGDRSSFGQTSAVNWVGPIGVLAVMGGLFYVLSRLAPPAYASNQPLGSGERFARLESRLRRRGGVRDPKALAAWIGRRKYGKRRYQELAAAGRRRRSAAPYARAA